MKYDFDENGKGKTWEIRDAVINGHPDAVKAVMDKFTEFNVIENVDDIMDVAGGAGSSLGTGGMVTKLEAAKIAGTKGIHTIIMNGSTPKHLYDITSGIPVGTLLKGDAVK